MAVKASVEVTVTDQTDAEAIVTWYQLTTSATRPQAPSTSSAASTPSGWSTTEPGFQEGATTYLYTCQQLVWKDGTCDWGQVQLSSSYEAAKSAYNRSVAAAAAAAEAMANDVPNLVPYYSSTPVAVLAENSYWVYRGGTRNTLATFTDMGDGWCHVYFDNTANATVSRCDFACMACPSIVPGKNYTFLFEYRNNNTTDGTSGSSQTYIVHQGNPVSVQFWGNFAQKLLQGRGTNCTVYLDSASETASSYELCDDGICRKRIVRKSEAEDSQYYNRTGAKACFTLVAYAAGGATLDVEMRLSIYEGEYTGPYKPYVDQALRGDVADLQKRAAETESHFWHDSSGAHVGEVDGKAGTADAGHSVTVGALGIILQHAARTLSSWTETALNFYAEGKLASAFTGSGVVNYVAGKVASALTASGLSVYDPVAETPSAANVVALFGAALARIGKAAAAHVDVTATGVEVFSDGSESAASFGEDVRVGPASGPHVNVTDGGLELEVPIEGARMVPFSVIQDGSGNADMELEGVCTTYGVLGLSKLDTIPSSYIGLKSEVIPDSAVRLYGFHGEAPGAEMVTVAPYANENGEGVLIRGRHIDKEGIANSLYLGINAGNQAVVEVAGPSNVQAAWRSAIGVGAIGTKDSLAASDIPNHSASKVTSDTFNIARIPTITVAKGGTGQTGVTTVTAVASFIAAASGVTISSVRVSVWGKLVHAYVVAKPSAAQSAAWVVGTVVAAYRPNALATGKPYYTGVDSARIQTNGQMQITACGAHEVGVSFTYLLA